MNTETAQKVAIEILSSYVGLNWAAIATMNNERRAEADSKSKYINQRKQYTETKLNYLENQPNNETPINVFYGEDRTDLLLVLNIDDLNSLLVNLPSDTEIGPAKAICRHVSLVLEQIFKMNEKIMQKESLLITPSRHS